MGECERVSLIHLEPVHFHPKTYIYTNQSVLSMFILHVVGIILIA